MNFHFEPRRQVIGHLEPKDKNVLSLRIASFAWNWWFWNLALR